MERRRIRVTGIVQGVGFRPFVHNLAHELGLTGHVGNDDRGVVIEAEGEPAAIADLLHALEQRPPRLAVVDTVTARSVPVLGDDTFTIVASRDDGARNVLVAADTATCDDCLAEVADPTDRRFRHAFANCTNCGPRYSIVRDVPYDRDATTMADFPMCAACTAEYHDPTDRRFHAQPTCCPRCGPHLALMSPDGDTLVAGGPAGGDDVVIVATAERLQAGGIVAIKGIGGHHLAAPAAHPTSVAELRARKHREEKPFAVMVADLDAARRLCHLDDAEAALLTGPARPVVLLRRRPDAAVADAVAPGNRSLGVMVAYTPLHQLLLAEVAAPIVLTSGNVSDEPIAYRDADARDRLAPIADAFLVHDRPIHVRVDDSVARVMADAPVVLRRSRGYAPRPVRLPRPVERHVLGVGAELKNTVCLARDGHAFLSPHIGDLENYATLRSFRESCDHLSRLFAVHPAVVAHDLHPEYLSTKYAWELDDVELVGVQHHHAHVASCLADNGRDDRVVGVAFDGTGYGTDATIWGGEFLVADLAGFVRGGHLSPVPLPGGAAAIREPWRMAASHLDVALDGDVPRELEVVARNADRYDLVVSVARGTLNAPMTSSMGRLFDAVAAIVGVRHTATYEGQAAIELEQLADPDVHDAYDVIVEKDTGTGVVQVDTAALIRDVVADVQSDVQPWLVASRFHGWVRDTIVEVAARLAGEHAVGTVALSGGVFQNALLVEAVVPALQRVGLEVLTHHQVPPNDGGIALGQVAVAGARIDAGP